MTKERNYIFFGIIIGVFYISLLYLDCFFGGTIETYQLKYGIIWMLFLETTFSLIRKGQGYLWGNWLWKLRLAVIVADFYFLCTPYNGSGIGGYIVVQMIYWERLELKKWEEKNRKRNLIAIEIDIMLFLIGIGVLLGNSSIYPFGIIYAGILFHNLKTVWKYYMQGEKDFFYLALSLLFLALCDTSIFLNFLWNKVWIGNLIWCFYIPSQLLLAKYE